MGGVISLQLQRHDAHRPAMPKRHTFTPNSRRISVYILFLNTTSFPSGIAAGPMEHLPLLWMMGLHAGADFMTMRFTPLHDRILVRRIEEQETTKGGLIIPDTAKEKPQEGEVLGVGKGKLKDDGKVIPLDVKKGDRTLFGKYSGTDIVFDGEEFLIMREDEVLGTLSASSINKKSA